jgi:hypothetical protein
MTKRFLQCGSIAALAILLAVPARAATVIDFSTGLAGTGGLLTWNGTNLTGTNIPIGAVTISGATTGNGVYAVNGTVTAQNPGLYGDLDFNTGTGNFINIAGCIPGLSIGTLVNGVCVTPVNLMTGTITSFQSGLGTQGLVSAFGPDTKNPALLAALGLSATTPFSFFGASFATDGLNPNGTPNSAISTDIRNTAVPEPTSLMLLGSGLLALCRTRRRKAE